MTDTQKTAPISTDEIVQELLRSKLEQIEACFEGADALCFVGPLTGRADLLVRIAVESIRKKRSSLLMILETDGGYIEIVERIVDTLRHYYKRIEFLIPDYAMSAGTVLAMSGDAIHMDYFSVLGPIDPQVQRPGSSASIPVQGYLARYARLMEKAKDGTINTAELHILIEGFDQAEIYKFEQSLELSVTLLKKWLVEYKFQDWNETETQKKPVTRKMKVKRAEEIARTLNDAGRWHTHSRGIPMAVLREDLKIRIDDFGSNKKLSLAILDYDTLLKDYMSRTGHRSVVHTRHLYQPTSLI